jgi:hypothetical protein
MFTMDSVIERGQARCPRCVAVADYFFVEVSTNLLRYEVNCGRCGENYREEHGPVPPTFGAAVDEWLPAVPKTPLRERAEIWATTLRRRVTPASIKLVASALLLLPHRGRYQ